MEIGGDEGAYLLAPLQLTVYQKKKKTGKNRWSKTQSGEGFLLLSPMRFALLQRRNIPAVAAWSADPDHLSKNLLSLQKAWQLAPFLIQVLLRFLFKLQQQIYDLRKLLESSVNSAKFPCLLIDGSRKPSRENNKKVNRQNRTGLH